ncbi:hypothetical protein vseg_020504 [Gypsophila vaccaria]
MLDISSYTSQQIPTSTITSNMDDINIPSSSSSSSSSTFVAGGRTLDRHNPIITDEKRSGFSNDPTTPLGTPRTNHILQQKPKSPFTTTTTTPQHKNKNYNKKSSPLLKMTKNIIQHKNVDVDNRVKYDNDLCGPSELIAKAVECNTSKPNIGYVSPPESSRYLLEGDDDTSFLDALSGFGSGLKPDPNDDGSDRVEVSYENDGLCKPRKDCSSSSVSSDQVVVLRVSLHCRGCEKKMKKHLSKMSGVTSFNVDFVAKKVTVVGDVTPLQVLANISKVKTAKLWSPAIPSYSNVEINTEAKN